MRQVSLVAFYGAKPGSLARFLTRCQDRVGRSVQQLDAGVLFCRYSLAQVHATIVGLERGTQSGLTNRNFHTFRSHTAVMRLSEFFTFMLESDYFPLWAQLGGFEDRDYPFQSRGARPYQRSFSLQGRTAVIIGWPVGAGRREGDRLPSGTTAQAYLANLEDLRRSAQSFNVLHRWHRRSTDVDNDLYFRLGCFEGELEASHRAVIEDEIRRALSALPPLIVKLAVADLAVVSYPAGDETLPEGQSEVFRLTDPRLQDGDFVARLYD